MTEQAHDHKAHDDKKHTITKQEIEDGRGMSILAYILAFIPYFGENKNKFVRFHAIQGMNILIWAIIVSVVVGIINHFVWSAMVGNCWNSIWSGSFSGCNTGLASLITWILWIPSFVILVIDLIGLIGAANGQMKKVPLLDKLPKFIKK
ncbi:MAG: hypothetical protein LBQ11_01930 [Candidatus Nomurabacteria bacterium]|jgi:uncharacterized membrane protein|nr:hypothetical protein [Candidatus Nomurabacteria bacterium]